MSNKQWKTLCKVDDLVDNAGVCALLDNQQQIAIFKLPTQSKKVFAIENYDPIGKANVLYRGIVGTNQGEPIVASPLYKQQFSLETGQCLQQDITVRTYQTRIQAQEVQVLLQ